MAKQRTTSARFGDTLVPAAEGEQVSLGVNIDRSSSDYADGARARDAGGPRDGTRSLNWVLGWDEAG